MEKYLLHTLKKNLLYDLPSYPTMLSLKPLNASLKPALPARKRVALVAQSQKDDRPQLATLPLATMVAAALLSGTFSPEEALAARSSGRAGGSSGFSSRKYSRPATS